MKQLLTLCLLLSLFSPAFSGENKKNSDKKSPGKEAESKLPNFDKLWNYNKPGETEKAFLKILPLARKSGNASYLAQLLTQIARTHSLRGTFEKAHDYLDEVEKMLTENLKVARIRYLLERGRTFNSSGKKAKARPLFIEAYQFGVKHHIDRYALDAAHMMGIVEPPAKGIEWNLKAIKVAEKNLRLKGWLGPLYNNTGWSYHDLKKYPEAMVFFKKSLAFRQKIKDSEGTLVAWWSIGRCYRSLKEYDKALEIQLRMLKEWKNLKKEDGYVYEELGELYWIKGEKEKARPHFQKACELLSQDSWLKKNEPKRLERLKKLGEGK